MDEREELVRELASYGIYQARKMTVKGMKKLLVEIKRIDEVIAHEKSHITEKV